MISDADIWRAAQLMTQCFRRAAADQAAAGAGDLLATGEVKGFAMWKRIERVQTPAPTEGEAMH